MSEFIVAVVSLIVLVYLVYSHQTATQAGGKADDSSLLSTAARLTEVSKARTETASELQELGRSRRTLSESTLGEVQKTPLHLLQGSHRDRPAVVSYEVRPNRTHLDRSLGKPKTSAMKFRHPRHNSELYTPNYSLS